MNQQQIFDAKWGLILKDFCCGDETEISKLLIICLFFLKSKSSFSAIYKEKNTSDIIGVINRELVSVGLLIGENISCIGYKGKLSKLRNLIELLGGKTFDFNSAGTKHSLLNNVYTIMTRWVNPAFSRRMGEHYTPKIISKLVVKLIEPNNGESCYDPTCGGGALLEEVVDFNPNCCLFGTEISRTAFILCKMNLYLKGVLSKSRIELCDILNNPKLIKDGELIQFDAIVANPPFSLKDWGSDKAEADRFQRFSRGIPPNTKADFAFISHMVAVAKPKKGRIAVVVPHGVLFRGAVEGKIRKQLIEENLLDAVIGLPDGLFPTTSIPVAVLIFDRSREKGGKKQNCKDVLFIDASADYDRYDFNKNVIKKIVDIYKERVTVDRFSYLVSYDELVLNSYSLNIPRYVDNFIGEELIDVDSCSLKIEKWCNELKECRETVIRLLKEY